MYSTLFRELHASRIQLDMNSTEAQLGAADVRASSDGCVKNDVSHVIAPVAILEQQLGSNDQGYCTPFVGPANGTALVQMPIGWESILGSFVQNGPALSNSVSSSIPFGFYLPGYLPPQQLALDNNDGSHSCCSSRTDLECLNGVLGANFPPSFKGASDPSTGIVHQLQQPTTATHQTDLSDTNASRSDVEDVHSECLTNQGEAAATTVPLSSSSSSSSSEVIIPVTCRSSQSNGKATELLVQSPAMKQHEEGGGGGRGGGSEAGRGGGGEGGGGGGGSEAGGRGGEASNTEVSIVSPVPNHRVSPQTTVSPPSSVRQEEGLPPIHTRPPEALPGSDDDDESRPPPAPGPFDRRRGSLGAGGAGDGAGLKCRVSSSAGGAANVLPSQMRRSSIPCISFTSKGRRATAPHLFQRPPDALDYEGLKVKLEKLTGPVTEGTRKDRPGGSKRTEKGRRTSIAALPHGYSTTGPMGPTASDVDRNEDNQATTAATETTDPVTTDDTLHPVQAKSGTSGQMVRSTESDLSQPHPPISPNHLQEHTNCFEPDHKHLSYESSLNSLSSSSSSTVSSSLDKFRLQCVIEHVLQSDLRLQEIIKRHELEREYVRKKHRSQWMEFEKSLTQIFGDEWRKFLTIPELSFISTPTDSNLNRLEDSTDASQQNRRNDANNAVSNGQNPTEPLGTITEGQIEGHFKDDFTEYDSKSSMNSGQRRVSLLPSDCLKSSLVDQATRRSSEGSIETLHQKLRSFQCVTSQRERSNNAQPNGDSFETRLSHNIANCLAKNQYPVGILNPNSSRLHRYATGPKDMSSMSSRMPNHSETNQFPTLPQLVQTLQNQNGFQTNINARLWQLYASNLLQALLIANITPLVEANPPPAYGLYSAAWTRTNEGSTIREIARNENGNDLCTMMMMANCIPETVASGQTSSKYSQNPGGEIPSNETLAQSHRHSELQDLLAVPPFPTPVGFPCSILPSTQQQMLNVSSRIGWDTTPGVVGLTGFGQNLLYPVERSSCTLQGLAPQSFAFPWTTANQTVYPLLSLQDYGEFF